MIEEVLAEKIAKKVLNGKKADLSIVFVNKKKIRELNKKYRRKNRPTDVLSFTYSKQAGDIIICSEVVRKNAKKFNSTFKEELKKVLIHGILHFFGYDHEKTGKEAKKMQKKEEYYFKEIKF